MKSDVHYNMCFLTARIAWGLITLIIMVMVSVSLNDNKVDTTMAFAVLGLEVCHIVV